MSAEGIIHKIPSSAVTLPPALLASDSLKLEKAIEAIFQAIADTLILIWYTLQHALHYLMSLDPWTRERVFKGRLICTSTNFGRLEDLPEYVAMRHKPSPVDATHLETATHYGFIPSVKAFFPQPYTKGHCFGNVALFLKLWLETESIEQIAQSFSGGSPLSGALFQTAYEKLYDVVYYPSVTASLQRVCEGTTTVEQERQKWLNTSFENGIVILDALEDYLEAGKPETASGMADYIQKWLSQRSKRLCGQYLASVREAAERLEKHHLHEKDRMQAAFLFAGLTVDSIPHLESPAGDILRTLEHAEPGAYHISLPTYSSTGDLVGYHALGLLISNGICYFLDSNMGVGWSFRNKLVPTLGRLFTEYTGMDYSEDLSGRIPSRMEWVANVIRERANPPSKGIQSDFSLIKVKLSDQIKKSYS